MANTQFIEIYERFANKVSDFDIINFTDEEMKAYCFGFMQSALPKIKPLSHELIDYDTEKSEFNFELTDVEKEIVACRMVSEWVEPQLYNSTLTKQFVGTSEERFFSPANQMRRLSELKDAARHEAQKLRKDYVSQHNSYTNG